MPCAARPHLWRGSDVLTLAAKRFQGSIRPCQLLSLASHGTISAGSCLLQRLCHKHGITLVSPQLGGEKMDRVHSECGFNPLLAGTTVGRSL